jgi:hypothetical protein
MVYNILGSYPTVSYVICRHWDKIPQLKIKPSKKEENREKKL